MMSVIDDILFHVPSCHSEYLDPGCSFSSYMLFMEGRGHFCTRAFSC